MTKVWGGPTPYDAKLRKPQALDIASLGGLSMAQNAYCAAMNSPVVRAMYEALITRLTSSKRNSPQELAAVHKAVDAYEIGLKENTNGNQ